MSRERRRFAVALAALAGWIDAVGYLSAAGYFVSFMSGNTTRLGVAMGTAPWHGWRPIGLPIGLIIGFVFGVMAGALIAQASGKRRKSAVLAFVCLMLLGAALARTMALPQAMLIALVLAMGALNNTFLRDGGVAFGLTYMTGALVQLGQLLAQRLMGKGGGEWLSWAMLWAGLLAGASAGAWAQTQLPAWCLWLALGWALAMLAVSFRLRAEF